MTKKELLGKEKKWEEGKVGHSWMDKLGRSWEEKLKKRDDHKEIILRKGLKEAPFKGDARPVLIIQYKIEGSMKERRQSCGLGGVDRQGKKGSVSVSRHSLWEGEGEKVGARSKILRVQEGLSLRKQGENL